jgi:hypothetical protein
MELDQKYHRGPEKNTGLPTNLHFLNLDKALDKTNKIKKSHTTHPNQPAAVVPSPSFFFNLTLLQFSHAIWPKKVF